MRVTQLRSSAEVQATRGYGYYFEQGIKVIGCGIVLIGLVQCGHQAFTASKEAQARRSYTALRLAQDGVSELSSMEAGEFVKEAVPVTNPDGSLKLTGWEPIIRSKRIPPGTYLTQTSVVIKATMGAGNAQASTPQYGHRVGPIPPEIAQQRNKEFHRAIPINPNWDQLLQN